MSNDDKVLLDLNVPLFQKKLFELDVTEVKKSIQNVSEATNADVERGFS